METVGERDRALMERAPERQIAELRRANLSRLAMAPAAHWHEFAVGDEPRDSRLALDLLDAALSRWAAPASPP